MSLFRVNVVAINPRNHVDRTSDIEVLVDTGSELTWLPGKLLLQAGIKPVRKRRFHTATKQDVQRDIGYAILQSDGFETVAEVVFAESSRYISYKSFINILLGKCKKYQRNSHN